MFCCIYKAVMSSVRTHPQVLACWTLVQGAFKTPFRGVWDINLNCFILNLLTIYARYKLIIIFSEPKQLILFNLVNWTGCVHLESRMRMLSLEFQVLQRSFLMKGRFLLKGPIVNGYKGQSCILILNRVSSPTRLISIMHYNYPWLKNHLPLDMVMLLLAVRLAFYKEYVLRGWCSLGYYLLLQWLVVLDVGALAELLLLLLVFPVLYVVNYALCLPLLMNAHLLGERGRKKLLLLVSTIGDRLVEWMDLQLVLIPILMMSQKLALRTYLWSVLILFLTIDNVMKLCQMPLVEV